MYVGTFSQPLTNSGEHVENYSVHFHFQGLSISFLENHPRFGGFDLRIKQEGEPPRGQLSFTLSENLRFLDCESLRLASCCRKGFSDAEVWHLAHFLRGHQP